MKTSSNHRPQTQQNFGLHRREFIKAAAVLTLCAGLPEFALAAADRSKRHSGSNIVIKSWQTSPPTFAKSARTLTPHQIARQCWKGYLTKQPDPWGMTRELKPTLRFHFNNRALPWPVLRHHAVDGFDNNARNIGAHALLHAMFGAEKDNDPAEAGDITYLLSSTDPESGLAYSPDSLPRVCPLAQGELARNVLLLYEQVKDPILLEWARRMLKTLRHYAVVRKRHGIGEVAAYNQGGGGGQGGFTVGEPPARHCQDSTLGGWQYLYVGWNARAASEYYRLTGDKSVLEFAVALENRLCNTEDQYGDDGSLRPDGSFGGKTQGGSWHMHGHTHCLPGLVALGGQLIKAGQREKGIQFIEQASRTMDWLYDPTRNPDAGSMAGWLGEFLSVAAGWKRWADCEGCTMGDVTQTSCALGAASRWDPSLADLDRFYDRAEQIYSGEVIEQMFHIRPRYLSVLRECLTKRVDEEMANASAGQKNREIELRYTEAIQTAERMVGQQLGLCGFPDWVNQLKSDLDPGLPGIHMQGCCADATIRASHAIWSHTVTGDKEETRVNLAFNRRSPLVDVVSCLPHRGEVDVFVKEARKVLVRVPEWAPKESVKAYVQKKPVAVEWERNYVVFAGVKQGEQLTVTYPLRIAEVKETLGSLGGSQYTERWRGNTIVGISPSGKWIPKFERPELDNDDVPQ